MLRSCWFVLVLGCSASEHASSSADVTVVAPPAASESATAPSSALSAAVESIRPSNTALADAVSIVAASSDAAARERAAARLIEMALFVASPAWLDEALPRVQKANRDAELTPDQEQLAQQLKQYSAEEHSRLIALMDQLAGAIVVQHCLTVATTPKHPLVLREAAVKLLEHHVPGHEQLEALQAALAAEKAALPSVPNAGQVIASMKKDFRRCWNEQLAQPKAVREAKGKLTVKLGPDGGVTSVINSGLGSASLEACLERVVRQGKFDAPVGGGATVVIPLTFLPDPAKP